MISAPHSTPLNGIWANYTSQDTKLFINDQRQLGWPLTLLLDLQQSLSPNRRPPYSYHWGEDHSVLQNEDSGITMLMSNTAMGETSVSHSGVGTKRTSPGDGRPTAAMETERVCAWQELMVIDSMTAVKLWVKKFLWAI